jgi:phosphoribosylanthranilate isomerase
MVKVKICGITNSEDALSSIEAGCDALGFLFYKESARYITPQKAAKIIKSLPDNIVKVGVFVDERQKNVLWINELCGFDMLQFHGDESPEFCREFCDYKVIKAFRIRRKRDLRNALRYDTCAFLFDTYVKGSPGGTGEKFDWELVSKLDYQGRTIFLSGGLTDKNVREAIKIVRPDWVDVSSSVEKTRGKKDPKKVQDFIKAAKQQ